MKTVKEIAKLTGISARTLHYYDEIGLLKPTQKSEAGYRLYDEKALETLQQILFFREFDIPLKDIKTVIQNPSFDRNQILQMQRKMLVAKKERIERLIASIDDILKGESKMGFEIFNKSEIEEMCSAMIENMKEEQKQVFIEQYGSIEEWKKEFMEKASTKEAQENFAQVVEWYGSKEKALEASMNPQNADIQLEYQKKVEMICQKLAENKGKDVCSQEIKELIAEYDSLTKEMFQLPDVSAIVMEIAKAYQENEEIKAAQDSIYGKGTTEYIASDFTLFPLIVYYLRTIYEHKKYFSYCKVCGKLFLAPDNNKTFICSDKCKAKQQKTNKKKYDDAHKGDSAEKLHKDEYQYWFNRLAKARRKNHTKAITEIEEAFYMFKVRSLCRKNRVQEGLFPYGKYKEWCIEERNSIDEIMIYHGLFDRG